jgi:hypothetical protein
MEKTFQYQQQIFAGLELEIYNDLLKKAKIFLQCIHGKTPDWEQVNQRVFLDLGRIPGQRRGISWKTPACEQVNKLIQKSLVWYILVWSQERHWDFFTVCYLS